MPALEKWKLIDGGAPRRIKSVLQYPGSSLVRAWTRLNELVLAIHTEPNGHFSRSIDPQEPSQGEVSADARYGDNFVYGTVGYRNVRRILRLVDLRPDDVFCDIGCGMGRILCVAAQRPMRKCFGVELFEPLCQIARQNAKNLRGRKTPIEIVAGDAATADLSEGTVYFMFNPFGPRTLLATLENIRHSLVKKPRFIKIIYYNSTCKSVLEDLGWLVKVQEFEKLGRHSLTIWENSRGAASRLAG